MLDEDEALIKDTEFPVATVATYECERGFELLGPARRQCQSDHEWKPEGVPFCGKLSNAMLNISRGVTDDAIKFWNKYKCCSIWQLAQKVSYHLEEPFAT